MQEREFIYHVRVFAINVKSGGLAPRYGNRRGTTCRAPTPEVTTIETYHSRECVCLIPHYRESSPPCGGAESILPAPTAKTARRRRKPNALHFHPFDYPNCGVLSFTSFLDSGFRRNDEAFWPLQWKGECPREVHASYAKTG